MKRKVKSIKVRTYTVYKIEYKGITRYIGRTYNINLRQKQHRNDFKKGKKKLIYDYLREKGFDGEFILTPIRVFDTLIESKNYEMLLILTDIFGSKNLYQKVPRISDV